MSLKNPVELHSLCPCGGRFSNPIPMDMEERMEDGFGRLLFAKCTLCHATEWAFYRKNSPVGPSRPPRACSTCGGKKCARCNWKGIKLASLKQQPRPATTG